MVSQTEGEFLCLHEIVHRAHNNLDRNYWDYLAGGSESEATLRRNRMALDRLALKHRVLRNVSNVSARRRVLGQDLRLPVLLAPIGSLQSFDSGGGAAAARAAHAFGTMNIQSSVSEPGLEEVAAAAPNPKIFQLYVRGDDDWVDAVARRAIGAGYTAFCITVDTTHYSRRERDIAKRFVKPWRIDNRNMEFQSAFGWDNVRRFKDRHDIPLVIKGIGTAEDAALCAEHGIEVVYVSNHGGRQLDAGRGAMDVLPEAVEAVGGRAEVWVDGSILRGTDVVKALALGANAVAVGRLTAAGLAAGGEAGLVAMLEILENEVVTALGLMGCGGWADLGPEFVVRGEPTAPPSVFSGYQLLDLGETGYN